jgi:hypothetical protein
MAKRGQKDIDEQAALLLAMGASANHAAEKCGVSESTIRRRQRDPEFRARVREIKQEFYSGAIGKLCALGGIAGDKLRELLSSSSESVALGACRTILEHAGKGLELEAVVQEVEELKAAVEKLTTAQEQA